MTRNEGRVPEAQARGKEWVRSFLFSVKIDSPLAHLHIVSKLYAVLALSLVLLRFIATESPDPAGAFLMTLLAFLGLYLSGTLRWVFGSYLIIMFPGLFGMALAWVVFNPSRGGSVLFQIPVYSGTIRLGISLGLGLFVAFAVGWYLVRKGVFWGIVGGLILSIGVTLLVGNPSISFAEFSFFRPLQVVVTGQNLVVALTKSLGYGAMMLVSLMLVMTSRVSCVSSAFPM
jgi:hypothetical protein